MPCTVSSTDPGSMTVAQLKAEFKQLAADVSLVSARRKALHDELEERLDLSKMQQRINALTPGQREAARQILCET